MNNTDSVELKKSLTNLQHIRVLEIIGLSPKPLSTYEIHKQWVKRYSQDRDSDNKYIYEIIKELAKVESLGESHPERFLKITYKDSAQNEINFIKTKYRLPEYETLPDPMEHSFARRILELSNSPRNWRYRLSFKGFLLYLISLQVKANNKDKEIRISNRKINTIVKNLSQRAQSDDNYEEFIFLKYFDIFDEVFGANHKVPILMEIAVELQFQLKKLTTEYLKYYVTRRLYDEANFSIEWESDYVISKIKKKEMKTQQKIINSLKEYKLSILNELISSEQKIIENMILDRLKTKKSILVNS